MKLKITIFLLGLLLTGMSWAQTNNDRAGSKPVRSAKSISTFPTSDIQMWCGTGSNQATVVVGWDDAATPIALVWGVRWNGTITAANALDSITAYDSRTSYYMSGSLLAEFTYDDGVLNPTSPNNWWCYKINGVWAAGYGSQIMTDGDFMVMSTDCSFDLSTATAATNPNSSTNPVDASIDTTDILYWVGQGANRAVLAVNWAEPDTCLAWGIRFDGSISSVNALDTIQLYDPRMWADHQTWVNDIFFVTDNNDTLKLSPADANLGYNSWWINIDGISGNSDVMVDGTMAKYGDLNSGTGYDEMFGYFMQYAWTKTVVPVPAPATADTIPGVQDATIAASDILYWVGEGQNQAIMAVNWNSPDTCLAWGFRFDGETVTLKQMMDAIDSADSRFSYIPGSWGVDDIRFVAGSDTLRLTPGEGYNYWWSNLNGSAADYSYDLQDIRNNDFVKWGDPTCGIAWAYDWGYPSEIVWTTSVTPVSIPGSVSDHGPYDGAVGTEGCLAIEYSDNRIEGWAEACVVTRGPQDIASNSNPVSYGSDSDATGACTSNNLSVVSLGDGGSAVLTFGNGYYITNGEGPDFAVFENSFDDFFLELAFVEVSSDGEHFVRFPAVSLTQTETQIGGMGQVDPTYIYNLAGKYRAGWGTPFDLEELRGAEGLDIDHVTHVRVVDVVGSIDPEYGSRDSQGNLINDPYPTNGYSGGFDLDGVAVLHYERHEGIDEAEETILSLYPNPARNTISCIVSEQVKEVELFDMTGRRMMAVATNGGNTTLNVSNLPRGIYMLRAGSQAKKVVLK